MSPALATERVRRSANVLDVPVEFGGIQRLGEVGSEYREAPFSGKANSGQPISHWYWRTLVLDMAGGKVNRQDLPVLLDHDPTRIAGNTSKVKLSRDGIDVEGRIFDATVAGSDALRLLDVRFPFQMSIWFQPKTVLRLSDGEKAKVNGIEVLGPAAIIKEWTLREVTLTSLGADEATSAALLADSGESVEVEVQTLQPEQGRKMTEQTRLTVAALTEQHPEAAAELAETAGSTSKKAERDRIAFILNRAEKLGTPLAKVREAVEGGWTETEAAVRFADVLAETRASSLDALRGGGAQPVGDAGAVEVDERASASAGNAADSLGADDPSKPDAERIAAEAARRWKANPVLRVASDGREIRLRDEYSSESRFAVDFRHVEGPAWLREQTGE